MPEHNINNSLPDKWEIDMDWDMKCDWDMPDISISLQSEIEPINITASEGPKTDKKRE